jgi:hypothetical protein
MVGRDPYPKLELVVHTACFITSATGKGITQATVYTNPLFYYPIKVPEQ